MTNQKGGAAFKDQNPHLARACWVVIDEHQNRYGFPPTGLYFNKALSLLHKRVSEEGMDLRLPHCWYYWGDEVVRHWIPKSVLWDHDVKTSVRWTGSEPRRPSDRLGEAVSRHLTKIIEEFSQEHIEDMVDKVYSYAPFEFQRSFRTVRQAWFDAGKSTLDERSLASMMVGLIDKAEETFPREEFRDCSYYAESTFESTRAALRNDATQMALVQETLEKFWKYWCHYLRLHPSGHENVPETTLKVWIEELPLQTKQFAVVFRAHLHDMLAAAPELKNAENLRPWLAKLTNGDEQASGQVRRWSTILHDVDDFVQSDKAGYAE